MKDLIDRAFCLARESAKAIAALAAGAIVGYLTRKGLDLGAEAEVGIAAVIAAVVVWLVPNRECS